MVFKIGQTEVKRRQKNIILGFVFSIMFLLTVNMGDGIFGVHYNDILLLSIVIFFVFANIFNLVRHFQWKKIIEIHQIEVLENEIIFSKGTEKTVLKLDKIKTVRFKRRGDDVVRMTATLVTGNKIRMEGYDKMNSFAKWLADRIKPEQALG